MNNKFDEVIFKYMELKKELDKNDKILELILKDLEVESKIKYIYNSFPDRFPIEDRRNQNHKVNVLTKKFNICFNKSKEIYREIDKLPDISEKEDLE